MALLNSKGESIKYEDIISLKTNALVDAVNPLKLYEYCACGVPVVATEAYELKMIGSRRSKNQTG